MVHSLLDSAILRYSADLALPPPRSGGGAPCSLPGVHATQALPHARRPCGTFQAQAVRGHRTAAHPVRTIGGVYHISPGRHACMSCCGKRHANMLHYVVLHRQAHTQCRCHRPTPDVSRYLMRQAVLDSAVAHCHAGCQRWKGSRRGTCAAVSMGYKKSPPPGALHVQHAQNVRKVALSQMDITRPPPPPSPRMAHPGVAQARTRHLSMSP